MTIHSERVDAVIPALPTKDSTGGSKPMLSAREQVPVILLELTDRTGSEVMQNGAICGRYFSHEGHAKRSRRWRTTSSRRAAASTSCSAAHVKKGASMTIRSRYKVGNLEIEHWQS